MATPKAGEPVLPAHPSNPIGGTALIREARAGVNKILARTQKYLLAELEAMPTRRLEINTATGPFFVHQVKYEYLVDASLLARIVDSLRDVDYSEPVVSRAVAAYEIGTAAAVTNFAAITAGTVTADITRVLTSDPWQRRAALVRARVFEQMQGFGAETATDLGRVLMQGVENGQNPLEVARQVRERFGVSRSRAERIARTEIGSALRRARWDETDALGQETGIRTRMLWISALSPTSRANHVARSGKLYSTQEVRDFYSQGAESINCKCSQTSVVVDSDGNPIVDRAVTRVRKARERYEGKDG